VAIMVRDHASATILSGIPYAQGPPILKIHTLYPQKALPPTTWQGVTTDQAARGHLSWHLAKLTS